MAGSEKRRARRFDVPLPVKLHLEPQGPVQTDTATRNISASGVYLTLEENVEVGSELEWEMTLATPATAGEVRVQCRGRIIRVDRADVTGRIGVAVSLDSYEFVREGAAS